MVFAIRNVQRNIMPPSIKSEHLRAPNFRAIDPWIVDNPAGKVHQLLSEEERVRLAAISTLVRFKRGETIFTEGDECHSIFNVISGVVSTYQSEADGQHHIAAFLYPDDLFGLAEEGRYISSAKAITPVAAYAISTSALRQLLSNDAHLDFQFVVTLSQGLRRAQRHVFFQRSLGFDAEPL